MDKTKIVGIFIIVVGTFLFLFPFLITNVNPDVSLGFSGLVVAFFGGLVLAANSFRKRAPHLSGFGLVLAAVGWSTLASGVLISIAGFLLGTQVACSCPASPAPCACFVPLYNVMFYGGIFAALGGMASITAGILISRGRHAEETEHIGGAKPKIGKRKTVVAATIVLTALIIFALFSYWPGVYITSINEQTHFIGGLPSMVDLQNPHAPPLMTSPISQPASGFRVPIGGSFVYVLHFNSIPSYPNYTIETISVTNGFSIARMNASIPLDISPANPSASIAFTVEGPFYPYYGSFSFFMTVQNRFS